MVSPISAPLRKHPRLRRRFTAALHPTQWVALSFVAVILTGTLLLRLPVSATGEPLTLIDAFFTAVSATCVTGLAVVDIGKTLSLFGQIVLLVCIQVGGLGLMTLTTVFVVMLGKRVDIADRIAIQDSFQHTRTGKLRSLVYHIVAATLITESAGALILFGHWTFEGRFSTWTERAYHAVFHSVSAFCNAGFGLFSDNLVPYQSDALTQGVLGCLIISGGLGFLVSLDVKDYVTQRWLRSFGSPKAAPRPRPRLSVHSKFVLTVTILLLVIGTVSYFVLERNRLLAQMTPGDAWLNSWFCSVTARTAGFNTIDYGKMSGAALLCTMVLMLIGASPGSTGGGIKTSTTGVLLAYALFRWRGHPRLHAFRRTIPEQTIERAHSVVVTALAVVVLAASVLMATETLQYGHVESQQRFLPVLFETVSAFGTVGLSMGLTPQLTVTGKLIIAIVMFIGRIGPLTIAIAISSKGRRGDFRYAEENLMVG